MSLTNTKTGFSVKDILDLPDTNDEDGSITGVEEDTEGTEATKTTGVLVQSPLENVQNLPLKNPFYDNSDNPYTRWLAATDSIQYSCKYRLRNQSCSSTDTTEKKYSCYLQVRLLCIEIILMSIHTFEDLG